MMFGFFWEIMYGIWFVLFLFMLHIPVLLLHEFGHWLGFRMFGHKAKLNYKDGNFEIGTKLHKKVNLIQTLVVLFMGIFAGLIPLGFYQFILGKTIMFYLGLIYILALGQDLITIQMIMTEIYKYKANPKKTTLYQMNKNNYKRYELAVKDVR